jgi:nitrate reductase alpha subunit
MARIETASTRRVLLMLAPETNGEVAVKAWARCHSSPGSTMPIWRCPRKTRRSASATSRPSRARSSLRPTWSGIESEHVCYNAGYTNVHELIPWRTLTGRQQLYQDHKWMRAFGEALSRLSPADRHQGGASRCSTKPMGAPARGAELHHPAPEVGDPLDLYRQPADADAVARRADRLDERGRRAKAGTGR